MSKGIWKKGWLWGVVACILIATVPPLVLSLLGVDRSGTEKDGKGGVRMWAIGFFSASNVYIENNSPPPAPAKEPADEGKRQ